MKTWVYDEETYKNCFVLCALNVDTGEYRVFQISILSDDRQELVEWLKNDVEIMIGYNNITFDYPVLHHLLTRLMYVRGRDAAYGCYKKAQDIISSDVPWFNVVKNPIRKQIDLYRIHHFDNKAKRTSLKLLEFNMRMQNIRELPYSPDSELNEDQVREIISYCKNDVDATKKLLDHRNSQSALELREKLGPMYGTDFTNFNDAKIGEYIFLKKIKEKLLKTNLGKTFRDNINLNDVIFDYIEFDTIGFQKILVWFKSKIITETKGVFSKIPFEDLELIEGHYHREQTVGTQKTLNIVYRGFQYDFGVGGIHGSIEPGVYYSDEEWMILDIDVASYYPNIAIKNRIYPEHLTEIFCDIYQGLFEERKKYPKSNPINKALKLALNGTYGKSNSRYSELYDPKFTMGITVNGQLMLCMLSEAMMENIPDVIMLQINTDGITIKLKREYYETALNLCKAWEIQTKGLSLEYAEYDIMVIRDVNNYIARYISGDIKRKGVFDYELDLHQNFSMLVVSKAVEAFFLNNIPVEEFIRSHEDYYDFFKRTKIQRNHKLFLRTITEGDEIIYEQEGQRITRYYISNEGYSLVKQMPPTVNRPGIIRNHNLEAGQLCTVMNYLPDDFSIDQMDINYDYYINEANKIIQKVIEYAE